MKLNLNLCDKLRTALAVLVVGAILSSTAVWAADAEDTTEELSETSEAASNLIDEWTKDDEDAVEEVDENRFLVMPVPIANPTIGAGLGAIAMYLFQAGENAPPSNLALMGFYTDSGSRAGALGTKTYFKDDKYRLSGVVGFFNMNLDFFGIGNGAGDRGESIGINQKGSFLGSRFLFQIAENLYLGPQYRLSTLETALQNPIQPGGPGASLPKDTKKTTSALGIVIEYDTRDNRFNPKRGVHLEGVASFASDLIGSDNNYELYEAGFNLYQMLGGNKLLAWRTTGCFQGGDTPYYDLCMLGSRFDKFRGYVGGQYRDDVGLTTQLEFRWRFYKKWGMVAFAGIGEVAPTIGDMSLDNLLPSTGLGIRFMASEKQGINLSVDYARGKNSEAWYFRIGEAF